MKIVKFPVTSQLFKFRSHPHGDIGVWHLPKLHYKNGYKKAQKSYDLWVFVGCIYFGCITWLRRWDLNHTTSGL